MLGLFKVIEENMTENFLHDQQKEGVFVVFFGRLEERKGLCTFVEAVKLLEPKLQKQIKIIFMGKVVPLYSAELQHLNSEEYIKRELDNICDYQIFGNFFSQQAIEYICNLDHPIVCLTSPQENFPNTALEMGQLPVSLVVSDTGGFRETLQLVQRKEGLYWFKPQDADFLAEMLKKAIASYPETPKVATKETLEKINEKLLGEKIAYIEKAFAEVKPLEKLQTKVTIGITCQNQGKYLVDCLTHIEAQTYENLEVIVIDDNSLDNETQDQFWHAKSLFPNYKFIKQENAIGLGAMRNHLVEISSGDYFLCFNPQVKLFPMAIEKFVEAAYHGNAAIATCAQKEVGEVNRIVSYHGGTLPTMMKSNVYGGECCLFSRALLEKFKHTENKNINTQTWEIITAAVVTGEQIVYYPYPLYEYIVTRESTQKYEISAREKYSLRQYLAKIPAAQWRERQIYMLLTAVQQLQDLPQQMGSLRWNLQQTTEKLNQAEIDFQQIRNQSELEVEKVRKYYEHELQQVRTQLESEIEKMRNQAEVDNQYIRSQSQLELEKAHQNFQNYIDEVERESQAYINDLKTHIENQNNLLIATKNQQEIEKQLELSQSTIVENQDYLIKLQTELKNAQQTIEAMETSKFWKLRQRWFNLKRKMGFRN